MPPDEHGRIVGTYSVGLEPTAYGLKADYQDFYTMPRRIAASIPS